MRRKSPRVAWLPPTNAFSIDDDGVSNWNTFIMDVTQAGLGSADVAEVPLVLDGQADPLAASTSLADVQFNSYRLRRIVGKVYFLLQSDDNGAASLLGVTAGIIVRRVDEATQASIASGTPDSTDLIGPDRARNTQDPWIWHRNWILSDAQLGFDTSTDWSNSGQIAATNYAHGPAAVDGPHVDQKTARIIGPEERLFMDVSATILQTRGISATPKKLQCFYSFRILGSMRVNSGNRRNASR